MSTLIQSAPLPIPSLTLIHPIQLTALIQSGAANQNEGIKKELDHIFQTKQREFIEAEGNGQIEHPTKLSCKHHNSNRVCIVSSHSAILVPLLFSSSISDWFQIPSSRFDLVEHLSICEWSNQAFGRIYS